MWKIFQKEALGILRYPSRIDFLKISDHVVLSEFTEIKATLKMNSAKWVGGAKRDLVRANTLHVICTYLESHQC